MDRLQVVTQATAWCDRVGAEGDNRQSLRKGFGDLPPYMLGIVCVFGKYQDEHATRVDTAHNPFGPIATKCNVARSNPTANAGRLQVITDRLFGRFVLPGMADKNFRCPALTSTTVPWGFPKTAPPKIRL